jgi:DNA polymerase I-like protein with 3'-5' exonuclease and polymerase domains
LIITEKTDFHALTGLMREGAYGALDVVGTFAVYKALAPLLTGNKARVYAFERGMQKHAFAMMVNGVNINTSKRTEAVTRLKRDLIGLEKKADKHPTVMGVWDKFELNTGWCPSEPGKRHKWQAGVADTPERKCERCGVSRMKRATFSPNSSHQCKHLFYKLLKCQPVHNKKGEVTTDDEALAKIGQKYPDFYDLTQTIQGVRDAKKQLGLLEARLTPAGRYTASFNVGAAWTGRWSSSKNPFGEGGNLQNIGERHRYLFEADPGYVLFYADLEQAESNTVAHLSGDPKYIEAHELGDVHTYVCRMIFQHLEWSPDRDIKKDKIIAKVNPPWDLADGHDYRFQSKRVQHGSNYGLTAPGIAMIAHIPLKESRAMQRNYFDEFVYIPAWHKKVIETVKEQQPLVSPFGREITLLGRPWDNGTYRQAFSAVPQSVVADVISVGIHRLAARPEIKLMAQVHDAILGQFPAHMIDELAPFIKESMAVPLQVGDRVMTIATEIAIGERNWGKKSEDNPKGIEVWHG